ncbi:MAG: response regulator transcription factor [Planctomycetota bacterium]
MNGARILVVEDDSTIADALVLALTTEGAEPILARDGDQGRERLSDREIYDCVLLDIMLPGPSGLELLRELRTRDPDTPVLLLTARGQESDKVLGLELGADDYVTKPFSLRELLARVRAHLRRSPRFRSKHEEKPPEPFRLGDREIDLAAMTITIGTDSKSLSPKEAAILGLLWDHKGHVLSRDDILDAIWGRIESTLHRTIDSHVLHLRKKLEPDPKTPQFLVTAHGAGYRLVAPD